MHLLFSGRLLRVVLGSFLACALAGCGSGASARPVTTTGVSPSITSQPQNARVPLGLAWTFLVSASGDGLTYQWFQDGVPIAGATSQSYTTPVVTISVSGTGYSVAVRNSIGIVTSNVATLTVAARAPMKGDLRFQAVDDVSTLYGYFKGFAGFIGYGSPHIDQFSQAATAPLQLGSNCVVTVMYDCAWAILSVDSQDGTGTPTTTYFSDYYTNLISDLATIAAQGSIITSMDFQQSQGVYAVRYQGGAGQFSGSLQTVPLQSFPALLASAGLQGRVVTAVSVAGTQVSYLAYSWSQNPTETFDTASISCSLNGVITASSTLASSGYIITAIGGNDIDGFIVVGTKHTGDSTPRDLISNDDVQAQAQGIGLVTPLSKGGYAIVAYLLDQTKSDFIVVGER